MVSQNQEGMGWDGSGSPSRTGSLLSLDGRQRPAPAKTPPSYYDAVRSRHSLSQPRPSDGGKQDKVHQGQQVKYNSLPRPLPQRYPPTSTNGQQHRPWPDDHYDPTRPNTNQSWRPNDPAPRQLYDSPPKPANHVPLQLQVHNQERYLVKRGPEQTESCSAPGLGGPRGSDQPRINGGPRAERLTVDCSSRNNSMDMMRKESTRSLPPCPDSRSPPALPPGNRPPHPRVPPSHGEYNTNSLPRRDPNQSSGLSRRCYTMSPDGSPMSPSSNYPPRQQPMNGTNYEPRYSKSGKLCPRPLSQGFESRPMPPPQIQLRTGPLGSYPDAETLKRSEIMAQNRSYEDYNRQAQRTSSHGDVSQQIYVDTNSYTNGQPAITDHLAIPYRIPQVSPKHARPLFENCNGLDGRKENPPNVLARGQPLHSANSIKSINNQQFPNCSKSAENHTSPPADRRSRRLPETTAVQYGDNLQTYNNQDVHNFTKIPPSPNSRNPMSDNGVIYANHQMSFHSNGLNGYASDHRSVQKRSPPMPNGNSALYENHLPKSCPKDIQDMSNSDTALYANHHMANARYKSSPEELPHSSTLNFQTDGANNLSNYRNPHSSQKHQPPPPVAQKPRPTLPQPSEMIMVTETRGWNGQVSSYPKDVVKPTPRMPRFANIATGTHLATVPAYQCVINELSTQNGQQTTRSSDSSTLSLRSGYDSSSSSVRDYGRQPSKSDSFIDMRKLSEGGLKSASSQQHIDKTFLSASMTSLCSDSSSSVSTRRYHRYHHEDPNWERMNEEFQKRKDKGSVFSASPWEREEKEKLQQEQILDARKVRDQEISFLESLPERNEKQEEWLRILRLEREFQRRAEQEIKDDEDEDEEDDDVLEKRPIPDEEEQTAESFHGDKMNTIPNERLGLKLLDELLENSSKSPIMEKQQLPKSPSEKHFIPLERTISESLPQISSMSLGISGAEMPDSKHSEHSKKPPIPAPRPSKVPATFKSGSNFSDHYQISDNEADFHQIEADKKIMESNTRSLSKLDISDNSYYHSDNGRDYLQDNWLIEVTSFENSSGPETSAVSPKHNGELREESRIYENIMEFQGHKRQQMSENSFGSHTLPKSNNHLVAKENLGTRSNHSEKKFPAMGISSTLSRKFNGHVPSDNDILPSLYASSKVRNGYQKDVPSELEDKSPEFKKLWISRPEKLTFQDKIRKFSLQAGEEEIPRDRVKNSRAQREIEIKFNEGQKRAASTSEA